MAAYLLKVSYNAEGIKGVMKEGGSSRVATVEKALAGLGGTLESFYFAFGDTDVYVIADLPPGLRRREVPGRSTGRANVARRAEAEDQQKYRR